MGARAASALWPELLKMPAFLHGSGKGFGRWIEDVESGSGIEQALYRAMQLPGGEVLFRRAPAETVPALTALAISQKSAALSSLRALEEEQALDFPAAERDWKTWAAQAEDKAAAGLDLADFYERRLNPDAELTALETVGKLPASPQERWTAPTSQHAWLAWERALKVADRYALPRTVAARAYAEFLYRYPTEPAVYSRFLAFLLDGKDFAAAESLIARYRTAFPQESVFPEKAEADLAVRRGSPAEGLAVYERGFEPLWPAELVKSYFDLVIASRAQRGMADALRAKLAADPNDGKDAARLFYLYQQQGQTDSAKAVLAAYRERKDASRTPWAAEELYTFARLLETVQDFPESARYYYALAADRTAPDSEQKGVAGLARILLTAPNQPLRMGTGNLNLYRNIATMDRGPGYLNGILSLWLNTQGPESEFANESQLAVPYFHRARAAELVAELDKRFPQAPERSELHARLMDAYAAYGEDQAIIREGTGFLAQFSADPRRVQVALGTADAYARTQAIEKEFALYQSLLKELAAEADGVPLGSTDPAYSKSVPGRTAPDPLKPAENADGNPPEATAPPARGVRSTRYAQVLDRYLSRLVSLKRLPEALQVLRGELDRNPQDPGLYERLASFLHENSLDSHEEEVYQSAIKQFQETGWYAKLARFYLRSKRQADYGALSRKVADIFSGTELEEYLKQAPTPDRALATQVNRYAHQRFPHDLVFVHNLLAESRDGQLPQAEAEKLLWEHWAEAPDLRDQLFEELNASGRLDQTIATLREQSPEIGRADWPALTLRNPAAERLWLESCLWQSHYELAVAPAEALARAYPADPQLGDRAASLYRSLAYFHPEDTDKAVAIEKRLLDADPGNLDTLARIGDIYADRERMAEAAPYFARMAQTRPGEADGYLQSATVFWDYFDFPSALHQLRAGRDRLGQPALYGYQAGAIEESQGNRPAAVREYLASSLAAAPSNESRLRLLNLARRKELQPMIEEATGALLKQPAPGLSTTLAGIQLRVRILDAEQRKPDLERELTQAVAQTSSFDILDTLSEAARSHALQTVEELALQRQISLTIDPVRNLQLRYQLADLYQKRSPAAAAAEIDAIYREHPKILGVVRSTVDYDWGHDRKPQAVSTLLDAAQAAYPDLKRQFQLEAARKLTDLGEYPRSRALLEALLSQQPLDASYAAALAENYARSGDEAGLEAFYQAQLKIVQQSALARDEKLARVGELRRGMIAAATTLGKPDQAADQYIELINAFPDDPALVQEAALYATAHGVRDKVFGFYQKTVAESPRDPRWPIVLARLATASEEYPFAIDAYAKAIQLRPERKDLLEARADLEARLGRLDDAVADYQKLYALTYRDPQWMEKTAEARARQGRAADAVQALETGWLTGRPPKAENYFAVAERLERWSLLDEARRYAEQGVSLAGADLLVTNQEGAATYARILARLRQSDAAFTRLADARAQAPKATLATVVQQVAAEGVAAVSDEEWRKQRAAQRGQQATEGFAQALAATGKVAAGYYTPEEKAQFAASLQAERAKADQSDLSAIYLPAAKAAGLAELEADWRWERIQKSKEARDRDLRSWIQFEVRRGQAQPAAARLEKLATAIPADQREDIWSQVSDLYGKTGDKAGELRALTALGHLVNLQGDVLARYYQLLLALKPQEMMQQATSDEGAQFLLLNGSPDQAVGGVATRAAKMPPVWRNAYTALAGLYLRRHPPEVGAAFSDALGAEATIADRIDHPAGPESRLAGEVWFYYGSRYAAYLDIDKDSRADDYLESELEHTPENSAAYLRLASYSADAGRADAALTDYRHSLELKRDQPAVLDGIATIQWKQGLQTEALASWAAAVKLLAAEIDARSVPESFWGDFSQVLGSVSAHGQYAAIRQDVDSLLRTYIVRNGDYRSTTLLEAGYRANGDSADWLLQTAATASEPQSILELAIGAHWPRDDQLSRLWARIVELDERAAASAPEGQEVYDYSLESARHRLVEALIDEKKFAEAEAVLTKIAPGHDKTARWLRPILILAEAEGRLDALLAGWKRQGRDSEAPDAQSLRNAIEPLSEKGRRAVLRFVYERALEARELTAPNFLGLAAIRLDEGDTPGAVELLKRMTLVVIDPDAPDAVLSEAASLLEERGKPAEALQFLRPLSAAAPWNAGYRVRLAAATLLAQANAPEAIAALNSVIADPRALYADRVAAAGALKAHTLPAPAEAGSAELSLLTAACPSAEAAAKPYFVPARAAAAACAKDPKAAERLLRDALAIAPGNNPLRLSTIWAAFAAGADSRALVAAEPLLQEFSQYGAAYESESEEPDEGTAGGGASDPSAPALSFPSLKPEDARRLFALAEKANEKRHDLAEALRIVQLAEPWEKDPKQRQAMAEIRKRLELEQARIAENEARAPRIHAELDQDRIVEPRLLPGMPFTPSKVNREEEQ